MRDFICAVPPFRGAVVWDVGGTSCRAVSPPEAVRVVGSRKSRHRVQTVALCLAVMGVCGIPVPAEA